MNLPNSDLFDVALKGMMILGGATLLSLCLRKASAALRHLVWFSAVLGILALPLASPRLSSWQVSWFPSWETPTPPIAVESPVAPTILVPTPTTEIEPAVAIAPIAPTPTMPIERPSVNWLAVVWLTGFGLCLLPYTVGLLRLWRTTRHAAPLDVEWQPDVQHALDRLSLNRRVAVRIGPDVRMPLTWEALFPVVLLPPEFAEWTERRRRIVLLHELAHVKRFDWLTQLVAGAAAALHWFNPLAWLAARRMRIEREQACDDLVLRSGPKASDYADELLQIAQSFGGQGSNCAAIPMARRSSLECRLRSILTDGRERRSLKRWIVATAFAIMTGIVVPVVMLQAAEKKAPELAGTESHESLKNAAERQGLKNVRITRRDGRTEFQVDRYTVTADSVEVDQGTGQIRFRGKVVVRREGEEFKGSSLSIGPDGMEGDIAWGGNASRPGDRVANERVRAFVRLVMGPKGFTFEGDPIEPKELRQRMRSVPHRQYTVLELAVASDELPWGKVNEFRLKQAQLAHELGFEHTSFIGVHEAGSKGSPSQPREPETPNAIDATAASTPEPNVTSLLQQRLLELAKRRKEELELRFSAGAATREECEEADYAYEVAKDPGNKLRHAELKMKMLHNRLRRLKARRGVTSATEIQKAEMEQIDKRIQVLGDPKFAVAQRGNQKPRSKAERSALLRQLKQLSGREQWNVLTVVRDDPILADLIFKLNAHEQSLFILRRSRGAKHPTVLQEQESMRLVKEQLATRAEAVIKGMEIEITAMTGSSVASPR